jgi:AcrR family transcriptional regulator
MQVPLSRKALQRAETRTRLLGVSRSLFADRGFAATGTEEIVAAAGVTRGALYFHFADKTALFDAVMDEVAREIAEAVRAAAQRGDPVRRLKDGAAAFLEACCAPSRRRIYLSDGRAVLGEARWHTLENLYSRPLLQEGVDAALALRPGTSGDAEALAALLSGAMVEAAVWIGADGRRRKRAVASTSLMIDRLFGAHVAT